MKICIYYKSRILKYRYVLFNYRHKKSYCTTAKSWLARNMILTITVTMTLKHLTHVYKTWTHEPLADIPSKHRKCSISCFSVMPQMNKCRMNGTLQVRDSLCTWLRLFVFLRPWCGTGYTITFESLVAIQPRASLTNQHTRCDFN